MIFAFTQEDFAPTSYAWNLGFCFAADVHPKLLLWDGPFHCMENRMVYNVHHYLATIRDGDVVWVHADQLPSFFSDVVPLLKDRRIVLVAGGSDATFPDDLIFFGNLEEHLADDHLLHLFVQNCNYRGAASQKVSPIPIGIDFHTGTYWPDRHYITTSYSPQEQEALLDEISSSFRPICERSLVAVGDFAFNDSMRGDYQRHLMFGEDRSTILKMVTQSNICHHLARPLSRYALWKAKGQSAFDISPPGNGIDCHRTWDALALGIVPIVKDSCLNPLYEGLPVLIVKDWSDLTLDLLENFLVEHKEDLESKQYRERLTHQYWMNKIRAVQTKYQNKFKRL